ncbi:hypothetical protein H8959_014103 [Pygathrix nigripes]
MENDRDRLMTFFLRWRPGARQGDAPTRSGLDRPHGAEAGTPSTRHPAFFSPWGSPAPEASNPCPPAPPAPRLGTASLRTLPSTKRRNRLEMRAPAKATWKTQSVFLSLSRSQRRIRGQCTAGSRLRAVLRPNPLERGRAGSPAGDTARGAYRSPRRGRPSPSPGQGRFAGSAPDPHEDPEGFEKGRLGERRTQLLPLLQSNFRAIGGRKKEENSEPNSPLMNTLGFGAGDDPPSRSTRGVFPLFSQ